MDLIKATLDIKAINNLKNKYGNYLKISADIARQILVAGCELHADGEKILLEKGSKQDDIWGGGVNLTSKEIDATAVLNLRPRLNNTSLEILDPDRRKKFIDIVRKIFAVLWD